MTTSTSDTKRQAAKAAPEKEPLSDQMAEEAAPPEKPEGSPDLWPFNKLPRRVRANFMRAFGKVETAVDTLGIDPGEASPDGQPADDAESPNDDESVSLEQAAQMYDLMADLEDALRVAAIDVEQFDTWALDCPDEDISALANWYMARFQVGEAKASSS